MAVAVLFVDDEEDIRFSFEAHFEGTFQLYMAEDGKDALEVLATRSDIGVVVTDIRMPVMTGMDLIREGSRLYPDLGFIVVSGHGEVEDIIEALRLGARNYLRKPYEFEELGQAISQEIRRWQALREAQANREKEKTVDQFLTSVGQLTYQLPNSLDLVNPVAFKLAQTLENVGICDERERSNFALALIEILINAIEHGNLGVAAEEKLALKNQGEKIYFDELERRSGLPHLKDRKVLITAEISGEEATVLVEDQGEGFDFANLPDPTDPDNLFLPSGRGLLLAKTFLDEVTFLGKGNIVRLVKRKRPPGKN